MKKIVYFFIIALFALPCSAQVIGAECATPLKQEWVSRVKERAVMLNQSAAKRTHIVGIPYQIHLFQKSNGVATITLQDLYNEIDSVNYFYANANMFFYECAPPEIIMDDSLYDYEYMTEEPTLIAQHYTYNVLNMYFPNTASVNAVGVCGYSKYPPSEDLVVISSLCAKNGSTLAHEIGHYFGLMHTHEVFGIGELVDGSNCSSDGDFICDTPADPTLSNSNVSSSCIYTGTAMDANTMFYNPDVTNMMSYSRKVCRNFFSPLQYSTINFTMQNDRTNLYCSSPLSVKNTEQAVSLQVFPNPGANELNILSDKSYQDVQVHVFNALGDLVFSDSYSGQNYVMNATSFAGGFYFYTINIAGQTVTGKWIKNQ